MRGWGDQYRARFETLDGTPLRQNPATGFYEPVLSPSFLPADLAANKLFLEPEASRAPAGRAIAPAALSKRSGLERGTSRWEQRRRETTAVLALSLKNMPGLAPAPPSRQTVGTYVGLCLLVQFPDVAGTISPAEVELFCNEPGYRGFGNNGSVYDYYVENSLGRLQYTNVVAPYYTAQNPRDYYTDRTVKYGVRTRELILEALRYHQAQGFDFSRLTADKQGYVYALNVFYAGDLMNEWTEGLWPHSHHLDQALVVAPAKLINDYQITNMGRELTLGTFCHENGHMVCDFPDLYDYGRDQFASHGVGIYCLMCAGGATPETAKNPTQIGAYLKLTAGWASTVKRLASGMTATAGAGKNQFFVHAKSKTEYFVIENRWQHGRDQYLTDSGLAIWHVDHFGNNENQDGTPMLHYECALMQADGQQDLENPLTDNIGDATDLFKAGGNAQFGPSTQPASHWWDGTPSGLKIVGIGSSGPQLSFSVG